MPATSSIERGTAALGCRGRTLPQHQEEATMSLMVLGVDHRSAPTSVRESLAFAGECHGRRLGALNASFPDTEFVLLSTCNRVEVYAAAEAEPPAADELYNLLRQLYERHEDV